MVKKFLKKERIFNGKKFTLHNTYTLFKAHQVCKELKGQGYNCRVINKGIYGLVYKRKK